MDAVMLGQESDRQLVERALGQRDVVALQAIVHRHGAMVYRVCWRVLRHTQDTEDAFQATFLVLAQKLRTVRKHSSLASWLHGVAHRISVKARDQAAARHRRESRASSSETMPPDDVTSKELLSVLDAELSRLPDKWRLPLVLCYLEGRTQEEAAKRLAWSKSTLRSRLEEARDALARRLSERGVTLTTALSAVLLSDCVASATPAPELLTMAVEAVADVAAGKTLATAASATVSALAEGAIKAMFITKLKTIAVVLVAALVTSGIGTVSLPALQARPTEYRDPVEPKSALPPAARDDPAPKLVAKLGATEFADREAAQKELCRLGAKVETALKAGLKSENPEVRARCAKVLAEIRKDALDDLVKNFDQKAESVPDHPLWNRFKVIAGDSRASRELFAGIIKNADWLRRLDSAETGPESAARQYRESLMDVGRTVRANLSVRYHIDVWPCDPAHQAAYLLFLGSFPGTESALPEDRDSSGPDSDKQLYTTGESQLLSARGLKLGLQGQEITLSPKGTFNDPGAFAKSSIKPLDVDPAELTKSTLKLSGRAAAFALGTDRVFAKMLAAWLARRTEQTTLCCGFELAINHRAVEVLPVARAIAADKNRSAAARCAGLLVVVLFGTPADLPLFVPLFEDKTFFVSQRGDVAPGVKSPLMIAEARDYAIGLALLLCDRDPFEYGFANAKGAFRRAVGRPVLANYETISFGFSDEKARTAAHKKARAWLTEQMTEPKPNPIPAKLVEQLGSEDFAERESAQKQLKELGPKARAALEVGLKSENPEVVKRCHELLEQLARAEFDTKHWARFARVIGDDKASRALFERIRSLRRNVELLDAVVADPKAAGKLYDDRWAELNKAARIPTGVGSYQHVPAPLADVVGWMYLGTFPGAEGTFYTSHSLDFLPSGKHSGDSLTAA
jgi:RNA polymerase sigma factor (sigma-70 family)